MKYSLIIMKKVIIFGLTFSYSCQNLNDPENHILECEEPICVIDYKGDQL